MKIPLKEILGGIPGIVGIRLEEEPAYDIKIDEGDYQVRRYHSMVIAQTTVKGTRDESVNQGFEILATYIFGGNTQKETMSMTTPVLQSKTLPMTTPVLQEKTANVEDEAWTISFVLPADLTEATAPVPLDSRVKIATATPHTFACYRYTGNNTKQNMEDGERKLLAWVKEKKLQVLSPVHWAQYDQPFAVPFLKRNEAHVEVVAPN